MLSYSGNESAGDGCLGLDIVLLHDTANRVMREVKVDSRVSRSGSAGF